MQSTEKAPIVPASRVLCNIFHKKRACVYKALASNTAKVEGTIEVKEITYAVLSGMWLSLDECLETQCQRY